MAGRAGPTPVGERLGGSSPREVRGAPLLGSPHTPRAQKRAHIFSQPPRATTSRICQPQTKECEMGSQALGVAEHRPCDSPPGRKELCLFRHACFVFMFGGRDVVRFGMCDVRSYHGRPSIICSLVLNPCSRAISKELGTNTMIHTRVHYEQFLVPTVSFLIYGPGSFLKGRAISTVRALMGSAQGMGQSNFTGVCDCNMHDVTRLLLFIRSFGCYHCMRAAAEKLRPPFDGQIL